MSKRISVMGAGMFGFVLTRYLARKYPENKIMLYDSNQSLLEYLREKRSHPLHFPEFPLPSNVCPSKDLRQILAMSEIILLAVPTQAVRPAAKKINSYLTHPLVIVNVAKGLEMNSGKRISEIIQEEINGEYVYAVLSGGTIAGEMIKGSPVAMEVACQNEEISRELQVIFSSNKLRVYRNEDIIGVELAGALKNPLSIASGIAQGLGFGFSTTSALVSRGSLEIKRMALSLGAQEKTYSLGDQAAMGDIMTSCFGPTRNRQFGELIAKENSVTKALEAMKREGKLVEGYSTSKAVNHVALKLGVEMPVQQQVFQILYQRRKPREALENLMLRELKPISEQ